MVVDKLVTDIVIKENIRHGEQNEDFFTIDSVEMEVFLGMNFLMSDHVLPTIEITDRLMKIWVSLSLLMLSQDQDLRKYVSFHSSKPQASVTSELPSVQN